MTYRRISRRTNRRQIVGRHTSCPGLKKRGICYLSYVGQLVWRRTLDIVLRVCPLNSPTAALTLIVHDISIYIFLKKGKLMSWGTTFTMASLMANIKMY